MKPKFSKLVQVYTTPKQLREVADTLEMMWRQCELGQEIPKVVEFSEDFDRIEFIIDQDEIGRDNAKADPSRPNTKG